jgi:hypothetical protein
VADDVCYYCTYAHMRVRACERSAVCNITQVIIEKFQYSSSSCFSYISRLCLFLLFFCLPPPPLPPTSVTHLPPPSALHPPSFSLSLTSSYNFIFDVVVPVIRQLEAEKNRQCFLGCLTRYAQSLLAIVLSLELLIFFIKLIYWRSITLLIKKKAAWKMAVPARKRVQHRGLIIRKMSDSHLIKMRKTTKWTIKKKKNFY